MFHASALAAENYLSPKRVLVHGTTHVNVLDECNRRLVLGNSWHTHLTETVVPGIECLERKCGELEFNSAL